MEARKYAVELTGYTPLFLHADDIDGSDMRQGWQMDPANKNKSKPGDDRTPPWAWQTYLYTYDGLVVMPAANIMAALRKAGAEFILKGKKSFKAETQTAILLDEDAWPIRVEGSKAKGATLSVKQIQEAVDRDAPFVEHAEAAKRLGFELDVRRARVGTSKHVRVRPRFHTGWKTGGTLNVFNPVDVTADVLRALFEYAGSKIGLGDYRPAAPHAPGPYGQFSVEIKVVK